MSGPKTPRLCGCGGCLTLGKHDPYWDQWWLPAEERPITIAPMAGKIHISAEEFERGRLGRCFCRAGDGADQERAAG